MFYFFVLCQFIPPTKDEWFSWLFIMKSLSIVFRTFIDVLRCGRLAQFDCAAYCVPFRFACAGDSCPAGFILSAFTAFAT